MSPSRYWVTLKVSAEGFAMLERFTDRAKRVIVLAQEEARLLKHNYVGTEHILLGLTHEGEGVAAKTLRSLDVSVEAVRRQVEEIIGQGEEEPSGEFPFTPRVQRVLDLSFQEAMEFGHTHIGTEHILLGLTDLDDGAAVQALVNLGATPTTVRSKVVELLADGAPNQDETLVIRARSPKPGTLRQLIGIFAESDQPAERARLLRELLQQRGLDADVIPPFADVVAMKSKIEDIRKEKRHAVAGQNYERAAELRDQEAHLTEGQVVLPNMAFVAELVRILEALRDPAPKD